MSEATLRDPDLWTVEELEDADGRQPMWNSYEDAERFRRDTVEHLNDVTPLEWDTLNHAIKPVWIGDPRPTPPDSEEDN